ncbi:uncharacterized protein LOC110467510 isoform X2 [Mizuhopecten yessoensis]|uniref:Uncharacterized protein n=2 Tax=Mizuhopecten yessoensis TaxID=6573 RepID=A0A210PLL5_MIZYE|nr:uncharacterized protein LOC110467510 isoform X2 [Mizuhopecten yessoensis]OWF37382.1 hypothetical protein KP79_PYT13997 [Mizuhopecten yessoensis]
MKETVIQTFTILLMVCIILTIILVRWEKDLRHKFLDSPWNKNQENALRGVRVFVNNFETAKNNCRSSKSGNCNSTNTLFEQNRHSLNVSKRSSGYSKRTNVEKLRNNSQLARFTLRSNYSKHHVTNTSGAQSQKTSDKHDVINGADLKQNTPDQAKVLNGYTVSLEGLQPKQTQKQANSSRGFKPTTESYHAQKVAKTSNNIKAEAETENLKFSGGKEFKSGNHMFDVSGYTNIWLNDTMGLQRKGLKGYLIYDCSKARKEKCGGWSDRLSGILSTLVLATLTNRTFKINFDNPCVLSKYLGPNQYNWTIGRSEYEGKSTSYHILTNNLYHKMGKELTPKGLQKYFQRDFSFIRMNWDLTRQFRKYPNIQKYAPWITELHFSDIYLNLFNTLFKPSQEIVKVLANIRNDTTRSKTACAHLRIGGNPSMRNDHPRNDKNSLKAVWSFLDQLYINDYNIFVATDDDSVRKTARERFKNTFIDIPGSIMHIDQSSYRRGDVCEGFKKQLLDFLFLATCDVLVLSNSGFGMMAAYLRTHKTGLYCWTGSGIVPCSRYTVHDFYPLPILAPELHH